MTEVAPISPLQLAATAFDQQAERYLLAVDGVQVLDGAGRRCVLSRAVAELDCCRASRVIAIADERTLEVRVFWKRTLQGWALRDVDGWV